MRIKKFVGASLQDVTGQMKTELGSEAIILNTREVHKGGMLSFARKEMFEITAAVDAETSQAANSYAVVRDGTPSKTPRDKEMKKSPGKTVAGENTVESLAEIAREFRQRNRNAGNGEPTGPRMRDMGELQGIKNEVEDVKSALREIADHLKYSRMPALPDVLRQAYVNLLRQDVDEQVASDLVQAAYLRLGERAVNDESAVEKTILDVVGAMFRVSDTRWTGGGKTRVIALVGPTGVGKTTTIAKMAAKRKLVDGLSVALISADTYRIGAIEQLQTFAAIADIPLEVVYEAAEMEPALEKFRGKDVVYVDTVGRSAYNTGEVAEIAEFVSRAKPDEVHLVLSAPTHPRAMMESVDRFGSVSPTRLLLTKADEAASFGSLLGLAALESLPFSFLTTGQGVPDDIVPARQQNLARMICNGVVPHA